MPILPKQAPAFPRFKSSSYACRVCFDSSDNANSMYQFPLPNLLRDWMLLANLSKARQQVSSNGRHRLVRMNPVVNALQCRILGHPKAQLNVLAVEVVVDVLISNRSELLSPEC